MIHGRIVLHDLHEIATLRGAQPVWPPIINDQQLCFCDTAQQAGEATVALGQLPLFQEAHHSLVDQSDAVAKGRLRQSAAKPGFADAKTAGDDPIALIGDPSACEQALEQRFVKATARTIIECPSSGFLGPRAA